MLNCFFLGTSRPLRQQGMHSVHPLPAVHSSTVTGDLVLVVFKVKLIIIAQLPMAKTQSKKGWEGEAEGVPCLHLPSVHNQQTKQTIVWGDPLC